MRANENMKVQESFPAPLQGAELKRAIIQLVIAAALIMVAATFVLIGVIEALGALPSGLGILGAEWVRWLVLGGIFLVLALVLSLITSMAGSSRTLYQASVDGWLPKYLSKVNQHHAPSNAMLTDLCFNLILLLMSDSVFVIGAANVGYMIFNFLKARQARRNNR